jgi:Protein of unknown function (DUF3037)
MTRSVTYHLLQIAPDALRGEVMNVGIALHTERGPELHLRILPNRLRALSPELGRIEPQDYEDSLNAALARLPSSQMRWLWLRTAMAPLRVAVSEGKIVAKDDQDLADQVRSILERMVLPPSGIRRPRARGERRSRLLTQLTTWLRQQKLYSRSLPDIAKRRVVGGYPISVEEEVFAELALQNGALHVIESLDLRGHSNYSKALRNEASHTAMVLDLAGDLLQQGGQRIAVVAADNYEDMRPGIRLVSRKASTVISMSSAHDRDWLANFVAKSLHVETLLPLGAPEMPHGRGAEPASESAGESIAQAVSSTEDMLRATELGQLSVLLPKLLGR